MGVSKAIRAGLVSGALAAALLATSAAASPYVFSISKDGVTASGSITTDGTLGVLSSQNILSAEVTVTNGITSQTIATSTFGYFGSASDVVGTIGGLSATATSLTFDFDGSGKNFWIEGPTNGNGLFSGISWAGNGTSCAYGGYGTCLYLNAVGPTVYETNTGTQIIATRTAPGAPGPLAGAGLLAALASIVGLLATRGRSVIGKFVTA